MHIVYCFGGRGLGRVLGDYNWTLIIFTRLFDSTPEWWQWHSEGSRSNGAKIVVIL